jgi:hypothetical protein
MYNAGTLSSAPKLRKQEKQCASIIALRRGVSLTLILHYIILPDLACMCSGILQPKYRKHGLVGKKSTYYVAFILDVIACGTIFHCTIVFKFLGLVGGTRDTSYTICNHMPYKWGHAHLAVTTDHVCIARILVWTLVNLLFFKVMSYLSLQV